jgi:hypothetical protein
VLIQQVGTDGFGRFGLAALQEALRIFESLGYFPENRSSPDIEMRVS